MAVDILRKILEYEIIKTLGIGSMGKVYLARKNDFYYAIKETSTSTILEYDILVRTFVSEAKLLVK